MYKSSLFDPLKRLSIWIANTGSFGLAKESIIDKFWDNFLSPTKIVFQPPTEKDKECNIKVNEIPRQNRNNCAEHRFFSKQVQNDKCPEHYLLIGFEKNGPLTPWRKEFICLIAIETSRCKNNFEKGYYIELEKRLEIFGPSIAWKEGDFE